MTNDAPDILPNMVTNHRCREIMPIVPIFTILRTTSQTSLHNLKIPHSRSKSSGAGGSGGQETPPPAPLARKHCLLPPWPGIPTCVEFLPPQPLLSFIGGKEAGFVGALLKISRGYYKWLKYSTGTSLQFFTLDI